MNRIMEIINNDCVGCGACMNECPQNAIKMVFINGYIKPSIDEKKCVMCERCDDVCPIVSKEDMLMPKCYAAWASIGDRLNSSSGGVFTVFAKKVLEEGGVVFGAAWDKDFYVKHKSIENVDDIPELRRSKYVQSDTGETFREVKELLKTGRKVMYVGTPCQIAALTRYLKNIDFSNILLVDFICFYNPSICLLRRYLDEKYGLDNLKEFHFRSKKYGWASHVTEAVTNSESIIFEKEITSFFAGYFAGLYVRKACLDCTFSGANHYSDITLGDFWKIEEHDPSWNDGNGTSMILANTRKGMHTLNDVYKDFSRIEEVPTSWIRKGQTNCKIPHPGQTYFYDLLSYKSFDESVYKALEGKYDIGFVCVQSYKNYGSAFTNFALYKVLKDLKKSVLIINQPLSSEIKPEDTDNFERSPFKPYEVANFYETQDRMKELNGKCTVFIVGSDQLFNYEIYKKIDGFTKLNWVDDNHKKISYATSFGTDMILGTKEESVKLKHSLERFKGISLREDTGVKLVKDCFGIDAKQVIDPVFLCDKQHYYNLVSDVSNVGNVFAYILDPSCDKENLLRLIADGRNKKLDVFVDRWMTEEYLSDKWGLPCYSNEKNEVWLKKIIESDFVITDSFHGMCMAIIFEKQFVAIKNAVRGATRFESLVRLLHLDDYLFDDVKDCIESINNLTQIDYTKVNAIIELEKVSSLDWLKSMIES